MGGRRKPNSLGIRSRDPRDQKSPRAVTTVYAVSGCTCRGPFINYATQIQAVLAPLLTTSHLPHTHPPPNPRMILNCFKRAYLSSFVPLMQPKFKETIIAACRTGNSIEIDHTTVNRSCIFASIFYPCTDTEGAPLHA